MGRSMISAGCDSPLTMTLHYRDADLVQYGIITGQTQNIEISPSLPT